MARVCLVVKNCSPLGMSAMSFSSPDTASFAVLRPGVCMKGRGPPKR